MNLTSITFKFQEYKIIFLVRHKTSKKKLWTNLKEHDEKESKKVKGAVILKGIINWSIPAHGARSEHDKPQERQAKGLASSSIIFRSCCKR